LFLKCNEILPEQLQSAIFLIIISLICPFCSRYMFSGSGCSLFNLLMHIMPSCMDTGTTTIVIGQTTMVILLTTIEIGQTTMVILLTTIEIGQTTIVIGQITIVIGSVWSLIQEITTYIQSLQI